MSINERQEAALQRLLTSGELTPAQADAVRREFAAATPDDHSRNWLIEVAGYVGGGLTLAGAALLLSNAWADLTLALRVVALAATAVVFILAALVIAQGPEGVRHVTGPRRRAAGVLFALAPIPAAWAAGLAANGHHAAVWGFLTGLLISLACLAVMPGPIGQLVAAVMTFGSALVVVDDLIGARWLITGIVVLTAGALWTVMALKAKSVFGTIIGYGLALGGAQMPLDQDRTSIWAYIFTIAVGAACFLIYRWQRSIYMLAGGVIAVTLAVPQALYDFTNGALGAATILLVAGLVLVASSAIGMQIHKGRVKHPA